MMNTELNLLRDRYIKLNNSYKKKVVYRIGDVSGFYSEYNNMILVMVYCLIHKYQFVLSSKGANFTNNGSWSDFFEPFCNTDDSEVQLKYNGRPNKIHRPFIIKWLYKLGLMKNYFFDRPTSFIRQKYSSDGMLLTQDVFRQSRKLNKDKRYDFEELGVSGNLQDVCKELVGITWRYNASTKQRILQKQAMVNLPESYAALHIRWGDKSIEYDRQGVDIYIEKLKEYTVCKDVFILTDDYRVLDELKVKYQTYNFYTLCKESERGYVHDEFIKKNWQEKEDDQLKLWASVDIVSGAQIFIGTFSSNPGMFVGMRMEKGHAHGVDYTDWIVW